MNSNTIAAPARSHSLIRTIMAFSCMMLLCSRVFAQVPPDKAGLLNGEGMGQAMYAETSGYPGPKHVLDLADKLKLSEGQKASVQKLYDEMNLRAKEVGKQIVRIEQELHDALTSGMINEKSVQSDCDDIGRLRGKLRSIHLVAHLKMKGLLNETQTAMYQKLRAADEAKH